MARTVTFIYRDEESLPIQGSCTRNRGHPARAREGRNNRSLAQPAECFCGEARAIGAFPGKNWGVRCRATAFRSPCRHFCLELGMGGNHTTAVCPIYCADHQESESCSVVASNTVASRRSTKTCSSGARPAWTGDLAEQRGHHGGGGRKRRRTMKKFKSNDGASVASGRSSRSCRKTCYRHSYSGNNSG